MGDSLQETIRIRRKVYPGKCRLEVQHSADKRRILMGEAIVLLPGPSASFEVIDRPNVLPPFSLVSLYEYDVNNRTT
jgi:hypothetical protein